MIRIAGGTNVMSDAVPRWPQVSVEEIVARNPDVVFLATSDTADPRALHGFERAPGFRRLRAVEQKRVLLVDANLFNRPGPALSDAMRRLAMMIHPELQN
jgi:iron complex transport system substrate-binding protein